MGGGDPTLIEKTIHAFALLGHLAKMKIPFVFKGGTSLLLRLPQFRRLSIDVDILCPLPDAELDRVLDEIAPIHPFLRHEEDHRGFSRLPARRHFKFFYQPCDPNNRGAYVQLDVVKEEKLHPYSSVVPIQQPLLIVEEDLQVEVSTVEGLLGEKLTAFAPTTVGIPLHHDPMQVMKQLFDVAELFNAATDHDSIANAYSAVFQAENGYRDNRFTKEDALSDTFETARQLCQSGLRGAVPHEHQPLLETGRRALASHLIGTTFTLDQARVAGAKAACIAAALSNGSDHLLIDRFANEPDLIARLATLTLPDPVLQRLRSSNPEAFHYWARAFGVLGD